MQSLYRTARFSTDLLMPNVKILMLILITKVTKAPAFFACEMCHLRPVLILGKRVNAKSDWKDKANENMYLATDS